MPHPGEPHDVDQLTQAWEDRVEAVLAEWVGPRRGARLGRRWGGRLPSFYRASVPPESAAHDVLALDRLDGDPDRLVVVLKHESGVRDGDPGMTRVVLARGGPRVDLARAMPILSDLGLHVVEERSARLNGEEEHWIQDFGVLGADGQPLDLAVTGERVAACIDAVWEGRTESDSLNRLVVLTDMGHERLEPLRAYRRYRQRLGSRFAEGYQNDVIVQHAAITQLLVELFELRFGAPWAGGKQTKGPSSPRNKAAETRLRKKILAALDEVDSLDHDRILRNQLRAIEATYRTNAYAPERRALALKLKSAEVPAIPQPAPLWETYVHGLRVEGIHLRGGMIARGGLRWSERMDYRTEVLGLLRAQMVKNAVIVPAGAKGGFLLREAPPADLGRDAVRDAVRRGYVDFVSALLDVADDVRDGKVIHPDGVRVLDEDDAYLVVAADRGTATFSDTANEIAVNRGYWLGDAFASGGSAGYDHKALGITARGAWEAVKRHFSEVGTDPEADPITVVGIGDMSGDVFGNGMLLSKSMRLIAAYDHRHVFVDPDPQDASAAWKERRRLFRLGEKQGSSWNDYDRDLISAGGGVFSRADKSVTITAPMRRALGITAKRLTPAELIQAVLRAPVDLLFNGGIGTVVKASFEDDGAAEDRGNDAIRVNARDLRAAVVGEGGNLGFTPAARIEYAQSGGRINADFIDNSGGVNCSDHEVNLKILLDLAVRKGKLPAKSRNRLLREVSDDVVAHVLAGSFAQARILTQEERRASRRTQAAEELMESLEAEGHLDRLGHGLPSAEELAERRSDGTGLTRPELAVLVALAKDSVAQALLREDALDDPALVDDVAGAFPPAVVKRFKALIAEHPLRRELAATLIAGEVVNTLGPTFVARRKAEFGSSSFAVVRAFRIAVGAAEARALWDRIDGLQDVEPETIWELRAAVNEQVRITSRWFLAHEDRTPIADAVETYCSGAKTIRDNLEKLLPDDLLQERANALVQRGVPQDLAEAVTAGSARLLGPHIVTTAKHLKRSVIEVATAVLYTGDALSLNVLHEAVGSLPTPDRLTRWSVQALHDDLLEARVAVARSALQASRSAAPRKAVDAFLAAHEADVQRLHGFLRELSGDDEAGRSFASTAASLLAVRQLDAMVTR